MARGKYAARAANSRADEAKQSAAQLQNLLAAERVEHHRKVAELNGEIARLRGQFSKAVDTAAEAEVKRVHEDSERQITDLLYKLGRTEGQLRAARERYDSLAVRAARVLTSYGLTATEATEVLMHATGRDGVIDDEREVHGGMASDRVVSIQRVQRIRNPGDISAGDHADAPEGGA